MSDSVLFVLKRNLKKALAAENFSEAEMLLDRLKSQAPLDRETRGFELEYLIKAKRYSEAKSLAEQLRRAHPDSSRVLFLSGQLAYRLKNYGPAADYFRESSRLYPHMRSTWWLGKTLTQSGHLDEAQELLEEVEPHNALVLRDLAWLFERKRDYEKAIKCYQKLEKIQPDTLFFKEQIVKLKARLLRPEMLVEELQALDDLGEGIPQNLMADYIEKLYLTGHGDKARKEIESRCREWSSNIGTQVGWVCYHAQAYDLAYDLFIMNFEQNFKKFSFLNSLESSARKCRRVEALIEIYSQYSERYRSFYGRIKRLENH